jgi:3-deoxy-7-phosphoheptulonate synthase
MPIQSIQSIFSPEILHVQMPASPDLLLGIRIWRETIQSMIHWKDNRLLVIVWPCSIHDPESAIEYAKHVRKWRDEFKDSLEIVMRTYWEKPRTTIGWKWLINDPHLDGSHDIASGFRIARQLLIDIANIGVPTATEFLDPLSAPYIADLISWGAIGARTTESQTHRELASSLSCPVGFKNGTDGSIKIAIDAMISASTNHSLLWINHEWAISIITTSGNKDSHIILRGSNKWTNFDNKSIQDASILAQKNWLPKRIMIDASHQNSQKDYQKQIFVIDSIVDQIQQGEKNILGVMIESSLIDWNQVFNPEKSNKNILVYGQSITDWCVDISETYQILQKLVYGKQYKIVTST